MSSLARTRVGAARRCCIATHAAPAQHPRAGVALRQALVQRSAAVRGWLRVPQIKRECERAGLHPAAP